ncbi:helicase-exonuclease AddAB, AddB subunit [Enterococcus phoeniculicola]|uniref:ATP-dependent helicase/deoxyribonuclease subunit B n=1 Tax=Enterococcus phoeniculicola ATCC BAA-412 TaxID=1158610 RepID=R3TWY0_9ENTE|nr:PD-(D/E)XK nuclease family protein [Enterococcus phoeniculicola]EOL46109.1 helicase-exonuclease AddAB, AddB subunit [Enterococcus phoeniculicola ATCC BAA-412]EOT77046.1 helicase-exonuclease AddAB, AddB subunit [Enterococcus phoeniculicola ATCC BAA-412]OJG73385.1 helicase-exonuclease AddAB, AddB subunit [Enterococcus phoeniculicola]
MSLQFIIGSANHNHQASLIEEANEWLSKNPKNEVYFLVPNYNKFEQEQEILSKLRHSKKLTAISTTKVQVFSFYRLAWFFLQQTTLLSGNELSEAGAAMIFRQILEKEQENLTVFRGEVNKTGFIQQLYSLYTELKSGNITPEDLQITYTNPKAKQLDEQLKLTDLSYLFSKFEEELLNRDIHSPDVLDLLMSYLPTIDLTHTKFIVSGFSHFNAQEHQLVSTLMTYGHLSIALILDVGYPAEKPQPLNLFRETGEVYYRLRQVAAERGIQTFIDKVAPVKQKIEEFDALNNLWIATQNQEKFQKKQFNHTQAIQIWRAETPTVEIQHIAVEIRRLVSEEHYRYRDIQLLTGDVDLYKHLIEPVFTQMDIPCYIDEDQLMEQHPLVEFLNSLFAIDRYQFRLADIFRFLRTELFLPNSDSDTWLKQRDNFRRKVDITENISLAYNFQGSFWTRERDWHFISYDFESETLNESESLETLSNEIRKLIQNRLPEFFKTIKKAKTGNEAAVFLYKFLIASGVETQLIAWRDQEVARGNLEAARNHEQTWNAFIDLLDEYVTIYGRESFDWRAFQDILSSGLENLSYGKIPTAIDQVQVNKLDLARIDQAKITFAIGLNDQIFPGHSETKGLLTSEERQLLNERLEDNQYLVDASSQSMSQKPFQAYLVFLSASEKLYLTYSANYDTQKNLRLSPYVSRINDYLGIPIQEKISLHLTSELSQFVGTYRSLISSLNTLYRLSDEEKVNIPLNWQTIEKKLKNSSYAPLAEKVFSSRSYQNIPVSLSADLAEKLYGEDLYASISRMESFYNCQYKYFANFGLKLKERELYGLTPAATGDFYHEALDQFFKLLFSKDLLLTDLNEEQRSAFAEEVLKNVFGEIRFEILASSARMNYIRHQLSQTIQKVAWALQKQSQRTNMSPLQTEILFGQIAGEKGIPGIELPLNNGGKLHLRGKIDRLDVAKNENQTWLSVIDYKSSGRSFDITEAYYGLAMQLLTYLDVALMDATRLTGQAKESIHPAGAFYLHVHNPVLTSENSIEKETLKKYSYDGLFVDEPELFSTLDNSLEAKESSLLYPIKKNAKDLYQKNALSKDKFFTEDELAKFMEHNRKNMKEAGNSITSGEIQLNPSYKDKQRIACQYCPFRSICTFDVMLKENNYHRLEKLTKEEALQKIQEEQTKATDEGGNKHG